MKRVANREGCQCVLLTCDTEGSQEEEINVEECEVGQIGANLLRRKLSISAPKAGK